MKKYGVYITKKNKVMTVWGNDEAEAIEVAERQLNRPGRYGILKVWRENGKMVKEIE